MSTAACNSNTRIGLVVAAILWAACYLFQRWGPRPGVVSPEAHPPRWVALLCGFPRRDGKVEVGFCGMQLACLLFLLPGLMGCSLGLASAAMIHLGAVLAVLVLTGTFAVSLVLKVRELRAEDRFWKETEAQAKRGEDGANEATALDHPSGTEGRNKTKRTRHG